MISFMGNLTYDANEPISLKGFGYNLEVGNPRAIEHSHPQVVSW